MRDDRGEGEPQQVNKRNLLIALGAVGGILLLSNLDGPSIRFGSDDDVREVVSEVVEDIRDERRDAIADIDVESAADERIDAAAERLEAAIEERVARDLERAAEELEGDEMEDAIEELKEGDSERFLQLMERY